MKASIAVLGASAAVCALAILQAHADPIEPSADTPAALATKAETSGWEVPALPHFQAAFGQDWFPVVAKRMGLEGRVLVGFDIDARGRAKNISVIWSENTVFESSAVEILKGARFSLPSDWANSGASRRWRLGFVYRLFPASCQSDQFAIPVEKVVITGSRLTGAPVRSGSGANSGGCAPASPH
jgi:TonB family protein